MPKPARFTHEEMKAMSLEIGFEYISGPLKQSGKVRTMTRWQCLKSDGLVDITFVLMQGRWVQKRNELRPLNSPECTASQSHGPCSACGNPLVDPERRRNEVRTKIESTERNGWTYDHSN